MQESSDKKNNSILIIGGGTAGWLSAAILAKSLGCGKPDGVSVTLVESPTIPILGVGEGTWPNLRATLHKIGVSESDFIRECDATFKQGAEFVDWRVAPTEARHESYYHPLSTVSHSSYDLNLAPYWLLAPRESRLPYDRAVATQARLCDHNLGPKQIVTPEFRAVEEYAYHLDANKFAAFLKKHCLEKLNVRYVSANVLYANKTPDEYISSVTTDKPEHATLHADFFIDCSGAKGLLVNQTYNIGWTDISDIIFNDTALAVQVPYNDPLCPIKTHTVATAQTAGWIWDIGLQTRRGVGHVYASKYISDDEAAAQLASYIGEQAGELSFRTLKLNHGYRNKFWHKNMVAVGMAAGFVEPLEASAIFLTDAAANMIASQFPRHQSQMPYAEQRFNEYFSMRMQRSVDFIKLHYCISERRDSRYWKDNTDKGSIPQKLRERLAFWRHTVPTKYDFDNAWEPFNLDSYLYVLYGMGYPTDITHNATAFQESSRAERAFADINKAEQILKQQLPGQRELIEKVREYGLSRV